MRNAKRFIRNDGEYMLLKGESSKPLFLFVHGYGTSAEDLLPLALSFNRQSFNCSLVLLNGHGETGRELEEVNYGDWKQQVKSAYEHYSETFDSIYFVGFSIGAAICIDLARECSIAGVLAISTFLSRSKSDWPLRIARLFPINRFLSQFPRTIHVTKRSSRRQLVYSKTLPISKSIELVGAVSHIPSHLVDVSCPVLFIHSFSDPVAKYSSVAEVAKQAPSNNFYLVTFRELSHFLQFDVKPEALVKLTLTFFRLEPDVESIQPTHDFRKELWAQTSSEHEHWSGMLFQLIVGFFSIFGALVYFTLPDVLTGKPTAPYYLLAYSTITSLFLLLVSLYYFYVDRAIAYMKHYLDPFCTILPWMTYRTLRSASGRESAQMTRRISRPVAGIPIAISLASLCYTVSKYGERFSSFESNNFLLQAFLLTSTILFCLAIRALITLARHSRRELRRILPPTYISDQLNNAIRQAYLSTVPGCVKQPDSTILKGVMAKWGS